VYLLSKIFFLLSLFIFSISGVSDKQRMVIDNQIFLLKEGMITKDKVFKKAKKFDDTGIFGIGSDEMTKEEFEEYLKSKSFTIHD
jgi:hypothetical protein|tara:strand:+ start:390 stop:644 length:255 start_codon:yes stop_codon:yes gene_type:complete